ncbi:MAG: malic enzyme-like NAD(P)-binding protein, partial [Bradyrhizobium sp.]
CLADPLYIGWRNERVRGQRFTTAETNASMKSSYCWPHVLLQWEDFAKNNATRMLERYRDRLLTFNDDIQGTAAVAVAGMLGACRIRGDRLRDHRIVFYGAGSAAIGIAD